MVPSLAALPPPPIPIPQVGERGAGKESSSATSSRYFTLPQHHNKVEGRCDCFQRASSEFGEGGERPKEEEEVEREREGVVFRTLQRVSF